MEAQPVNRGVTFEALQRAREIRERIRERLLAEGQPVGSIVDDLNQLRNERLANLDESSASGKSFRITPSTLNDFF